MFAWEDKEFFWGFLIVAFLFFIYIWKQRFHKKSLNKFGDFPLLSYLFPDISYSKAHFKFFLILLGISFLILAIANPLLGTKLVEAKRQGVDVVILLDISNSMKAVDIKPNRLERAKQMIIKLIDKLVNDRIGIVVFAGEPFIQLPLTTDYGAAKLFTTYIDTDIVPTQGTAIGSAIELAIDKFNFDPKKKKVMIIVTDGENHEDDAISATEVAVRNNFVVHTIGMGSLNGGPIPILTGSSRDFLKDKNGSVVITRTNPEMLERIAAIGGGEFVMNLGIDPDLSLIVEKISKMEKKEYETKIFSNFESQYQYPLFVAFVLLLVEIFLTERRNKFFVVLNKFFKKSSNKYEI